MAKRGMVQSLIEGRCPKCRNGKMFKKSIINPFSLIEMHTHCSKCDLTFEKEPGFYNGAMYISYAISVALFFVSGATLYLFFNDPPASVYITTIVGIVLLVFPYNFKYSRIIFLYAFGDYEYDESLNES